MNDGRRDSSPLIALKARGHLALLITIILSRIEMFMEATIKDGDTLIGLFLASKIATMKEQSHPPSLFIEEANFVCIHDIL